jgi:hypothetical protein
MFSCHSQANTSLPDHTEDLERHFGITMSREALHKRFTPSAADFLKEVIKLKMDGQVRLAENDGLRSHFSAINVKDSTKYALPTTFNGQYPSFGNFGKSRGLMNLQYEYDLISGRWKSLELTSIRKNDQQNSRETVDGIAENELHIRDLGYVTPTYLKAVIHQGAFFLNRLPTNINIYSLDGECIDWKRIHRGFNENKTGTMEMDVRIYERERLQCRLVIERVGDLEYGKRLEKARKHAKSKGVGISDLHKLRCRYNTFITNVGREILPAEKIRKTYYLRWQIELVFKTWKSLFEINKLKRMNRERMECQLLGKLLWVLLNWQLFRICNNFLKTVKPETGMSTIKFGKRCLKFSESLRRLVLRTLSIENWLLQDFLPLMDNAFCEAPKGKITHYQTLNLLS